MIISVFTEKYDSIQKQLINSAIVENNNNTIQVVSQWDTGATGTCISKELVQKLGLLPTGMVNVHTPSGVGTMNKYMINLILNKEVKISNLPVMDSEIGKQGIDVLIGMDIISLGDFAISNYDKKTQFSFRIPSQEHVEYHR
jgi:predicted aspartyl protease